MEFTGQITDIRKPRTGQGQKGEWASVEFEVMEINPKNKDYPQIGLFDMFKSGEYTKYAKDFHTYYPIGTVVKVEFNLKKSTYIKEGKEMSFYKTSAWKVEKIEAAQDTGHDTVPFETVANKDLNSDKDHLPF